MYFSENFDPYRYPIQKNVDLSIVPDPGDKTMQDMAFQEPKVMCSTCLVDPKFWIPEFWKVAIKKV